MLAARVCQAAVRRPRPAPNAAQAPAEASTFIHFSSLSQLLSRYIHVSFRNGFMDAHLLYDLFSFMRVGGRFAGVPCIQFVFCSVQFG